MNNYIYSKLQLMLEMENKSKSTFERYMSALKEMEVFFSKRDLRTLNDDEFFSYAYHLHRVTKSARTYNNKIAAIRYVYVKVLKRNLRNDVLPLKRNNKAEPKMIPSRKEVKRMIDECLDLEVLCFLLLAGGSGLRRGEIANLKVNDIIKGRNIIRVVGKGKRVRTTPIDESVLKVLREYFKKRKIDNEYLFSSNKSHVSADTVSRKVKGYFTKLGMNYTLHDLRRVFATVLYISGVDLMTIKNYLGHDSISTTQKYINVERYLNKKEVSPINEILETPSKEQAYAKDSKNN